MLGRRALLGGLTAGLAVGLVDSGASFLRASPVRAQRGGVRIIALTRHRDVPSEAWWDAQLAEANRLFAAAGLAFAVVEPIAGVAAPIDTRSERDALGRELALGTGGEPTRVHVFLTTRLTDVDEPPRERFGVHWRVRSERARHLVVLSHRAFPSVLAHELGHYFGNPHSDVPNNVMSYARDGVTPPFFDVSQLARIRSTAARDLARGLELAR